jgi:hypothetical protein
MIYHIAQVNVARLRAPLDSEELADFVASLAPVNASADHASGFVWRLQTEDGNSTSIRAFEWDIAESAGVIVNMSVWETIDQLSDWVYGTMHRSVLLQRRKWFERVAEATTALWWIPDGHQPTVAEAESRVLELRNLGPTQTAFTFRNTFVPPDRLESSSRLGADNKFETS